MAPTLLPVHSFVKRGKMIGALFNKNKKDPWEELYDFDTNTYFYRHRGTGEFTRNHPLIKDTRSSRVPTRSVEPLWETRLDPDTGDAYWTDIETGKVCYVRPETGTFITEVPLKDFRKAERMHQREIRATKVSRGTQAHSTVVRGTQAPRKKSVKSVRRNDDYGIVSGDTSDVNFEQMFGAQNPAQFDAGAMFALGGGFGGGAPPQQQQKSSVQHNYSYDAPGQQHGQYGNGYSYGAAQQHQTYGYGAVSVQQGYGYNNDQSQYQYGYAVAGGYNNMMMESEDQAYAAQEEDERREDKEQETYQMLDEDTVLAQSTIATDNPLFRYGK